MNDLLLAVLGLLCIGLMFFITGFNPLPFAIRSKRADRCPHLEVRCVHGDERLRSGGLIRFCYGCNRYLDGPHLQPCVGTEKTNLMLWEYREPFGDD